MPSTGGEDEAGALTGTGWEWSRDERKVFGAHTVTTVGVTA